MERSDAPGAWRIGRSRVLAELVPLALVLACIGGTLALVMAMHRRAATPAPEVPPPVVVLPSAGPPEANADAVATIEPPEPEVEPERAPEPEPVDDPTPAILARLAEAREREASRAGRAEARTQVLEQARGMAEALSARWTRRDAVIRKRFQTLDRRAQELETEVELRALERDVLARERDFEKAALERALEKAGSYAVVPYRGPNGTWHRPIVIECRDGGIWFPPHGPALSMLELGGSGLVGLGLRASPLAALAMRAIRQAESAPTPDGAPSVPYLLFVVRPDGIRAYYEARSRLEPLGITFGYELVEQDLEIDYADPDDLDEWHNRSENGELAATRSWRPRTSDREGGEEPWPTWPVRPPGSSVPLPAIGSGPSALSSLSGGRTDFPPSPPIPPVPDPRRSDRSSPAGDPRTGSGEGGGGGSGFEGLGGSGSGLAGGASRRDPMTGTAGRPHRNDGWHDALGDDLRARSRDDPGPPGRRAGALPGGGSHGEHGSQGPSAIGGLGGVSGRRSASGASGASLSGSNGVPLGGGGSGTSGIGLGSSDRPASSSAGGSSNSGEGRSTQDRPERPRKVIITCNSEGLRIQPGGYRFSLQALEKDGELLPKSLKALAVQWQASEPDVLWRPQLSFLIEPGGYASYRLARQQTILSDLDWPVSLQVVETATGGLRLGERRP